MNLDRQIKKVLLEHYEFSASFKRRVGQFEELIRSCFVVTYPCDFENFTAFMQGIHTEIRDFISEGYDSTNRPISDWLTYEDGAKYVEKFLINDLKKFYNQQCVDHNIYESKENKDKSKQAFEFVKNHGVLVSMQYFGGYGYMLKALGDYEIPKELKIDAIKQFTYQYGGVSLNELGEEPIFYRMVEISKDGYNELQNIEYLGTTKVIVQCWGGKDNNSDTGEYGISYEGLSEGTINEIFIIIIDAIRNGVAL